MSEQLGEAVLVLRTDDSKLDAGIDQAEGKAKSLGNTFEQTATKLTHASGAARYGLMDLGYQFQDFAVQVQGGQGVLRAFSQQMPQAIQALQLMSMGAEGAGGKMAALAGFLTGGWGIALGVAIPLVGALAEHLFNTADAAQLATKGADGLSDAQSALGGIFDLTTGKIKSQNEMLRLNARLMALNLRAQASDAKGNAQETFARSGSIGGMSTLNTILGTLGVDVSGAFGRQAAVHDLITNLQSGKISRETALQQAGKLDYSGLGITKTQLEQAIIDDLSSDLKMKTADLIDQALNSNVLPTELFQPKPGKDKKAKATKFDNPAATAQALFLSIDKQYGGQLDANNKQLDRMVATHEKIGDAIQANRSDWSEWMKSLNADLAEAQQAGALFIDTVFDPRNWRDFGNLGMSVLRELENEFIKLAILNPLKNLLLGEHNSTLSSIGGIIGKLFHFAAGTDDAPGGLSVVGEKGWELMNVPKGAQIIPHDQSVRMLSGNGRGTTVSIPISIDATGADAAALGRVNAKLDQLQANLPGIIVHTVADAHGRGMLN